MSPMELVVLCKRALDQGAGKVPLLVPREPTGERITLAGNGSPLGSISCWNERLNGTVAIFDAVEVLAWLAAKGYVRATVKEVQP